MSARQSKLLSLDAFAKTVEDAKIKTTSGGIITLVCVLVVLMLIRNEYTDYTTLVTKPELVVDRDINKKLDINLDITFPNLPCDVLTMDILDISGEAKVDILKSGFEKFRLVDGQEVADETPVLNGLNVFDLIKTDDHSGPCGSCYGALPQEGYCCDTCEAVRVAYANKEWAFYEGKDIEQCEQEGYVARVIERINRKEGCRIKGTTQINRILGNLHFAPGASHTAPGQHVHDLSLYNKYKENFNFDHVVNHLSFGKDPESDLIDSTHPLDGHRKDINEKYHLYSYYIKVVASRFESLNKAKTLETNQFSVIQHDRPLKGGRDKDHQHTLHAKGGIPGVFFYFEISPLKLINREEYAKTWSGFVLGVISSIAGVLMVGTLIDRSVFAAEQVIKGKKDM